MRVAVNQALGLDFEPLDLIGSGDSLTNLRSLR